MDRNCDAFIRSNNTYDILIARESLEISDDRAGRGAAAEH